jgi:predicted dienelactone hydrolase
MKRMGIVFLLLLCTGCKRSAAPTAPSGSASCSSRFAAGFRVLQSGGLNIGVWYPSTDAETTVTYTQNAVGSIARNGAIDRCGRFPLVVFSHGLGGCGIQSVFITEELARRGYIVAAPDHADALCSVTGSGTPQLTPPEQSFLSPELWTDQTYANRRADLDRTITGMQQHAEFGPLLTGRVGALGHSLGGYTAVGVGGGWDSWTDTRVGAVVAMSPYVTPYLLRNRLGSVHVPVMYQGAQLDIFITPTLHGPGGAYGVSNTPKYYVQLYAGNHFVWTNLECGAKTSTDCVRTDPTASLIDQYAAAFFDRYLKGDNSALSGLNGSGLSEFDAAP